MPLHIVDHPLVHVETRRPQAVGVGDPNPALGGAAPDPDLELADDPGERFRRGGELADLGALRERARDHGRRRLLEVRPAGGDRRGGSRDLGGEVPGPGGRLPGPGESPGRSPNRSSQSAIAALALCTRPRRSERSKESTTPGVTPEASRR